MLTADMFAPTGASIERLRRIARYMSGTVNFGTLLPTPPASAEVEVVVETDSNWAGCRRTRRSVSHGRVLADECVLFTRNKKQSLVATSSGEAEFYGAVGIASDALLLVRVLLWLGFRLSKIPVIRVDSSAAKGVATRQGVGSIRHLSLRTLWL